MQDKVEADPFHSSPFELDPCFACPTVDSHRPALPVDLTAEQVRIRAEVDTGDHLNPFQTLKDGQKHTVLLCSDCRHRNRGWNIICNPRKNGVSKSQSALRAWKSRQSPSTRRSVKKKCWICCSFGSENGKEHDVDHRIERNPSKDWTLLTLSTVEDEVPNRFIQEFIRLSGCLESTIRSVLEDPSEYYLCYVHVNHSRYAQKTALSSVNSCPCIFDKRGCNRDGSTSTGRLWRIPVFDVNSLCDLEDFSQLEETVSSHSNGILHAVDVMGRLSCRTCLYVVMEGCRGEKPDVSIHSIPSLLDQGVVRCVLFALEKPSVASASPIFVSQSNDEQDIATAANTLRQSCILSNGREDGSVRMLPFQEVVRFRKVLLRTLDALPASEKDIDHRTFQKRVEGFLAGKGVVLKKLGYRMRCYVSVAQVDSLLYNMVGKSSSIWKSPRPSVEDMRGYYEVVATLFRENSSKYWSGNWSLTEVVASIPGKLWVDVVLMLVSDKRMMSWTAAARAAKKQVFDTFPLSNCRENLPPTSIEHELCSGDSYSRADLLVCVRALSIIEQNTHCRTNGVPGPLTIAVSVSGICEVSPSFVSVLNAMGLFLSYTTTERYRQRLIAERERTGPWNYSIMNEATIPVVQFDNWDIKPLHAVKVDGKAMPKVNGSLAQSHMRGVKRGASSDEDSSSARKKVRLSSWKNPSSFGSRASFTERFNTPEDGAVLQQFNNVVFGLVALFRGQLVGGKEALHSEYNTSTRREFCYGVEDGKPLNFRTLLLSCFKPHGGLSPTDDSLYEQHVVYVDISRDSAADMLTVRRFINTIEQQLCPGQPGRPRYVILGGDQPTYRMYVILWLLSWRADKERRDRGGYCNEHNGRLQLHEWMIPFPGFFHAEKQTMYSICKEMLNGLGLEELAACAGLSSSHVANIVSHSHARNNRAVLFNLACALIIHLLDMVLLEDAQLSEAVRKMHSTANKTAVSVDTTNTPGAGSVHHHLETSGRTLPDGALYRETTDVVTEDVVSVGDALRQRIAKRFGEGPNGIHFVHTVLFSCLLPTIGFHVLSRTGHTDFTDAFWFKHNAILHSTTHLKYQELSLFYSFFRGIIPSAVEEELHLKKPGVAVMRVLSFTGHGKDCLDNRGYAYSHSDEGLESMMVRHTKSLSSNFLGHLENAASWLMQVSMFRSMVRYMTGASRSLGRKRQENDSGEGGPLNEYDRNAAQWRTVSRMLHVMREVGFLSVSHRGSEWLTNVFSNPHKRMNIKRDQDSILNIAEAGKLTSQLHASVLFPDVFGGITEEDRNRFFNRKKFKRWTKSRAVIRPSQSMRKSGGVVVGEGDQGGMVSAHHASRSTGASRHSLRRPSGKEAMTKLVQERRRRTAKAKDAFHEEMRLALAAGNQSYLNVLMSRWDAVHSKRFLITPFADCFLDQRGRMNHAVKSRFLKYGVRDNREIIYPFNQLLKYSQDAVGGLTTTATGAESRVSRNVFESGIPLYYALQVDVMNALHFRGDTGLRGTSLKDVVTGKMKSVLRTYVTGPRAASLVQIHLHIDDRTVVLRQKTSEQARRDASRGAAVDEGEDSGPAHVINELEYDAELNVPWSSLLVNRLYKDELASLHLFCSAVAVFELLRETKRSGVVFLHGGAFVAPATLLECTPMSLAPRRISQTKDEDSYRGRVVLENMGLEKGEVQDLFIVPRSRCLVFDSKGGTYLGHSLITHGESETRFVAVMKRYISPSVQQAEDTGHTNSFQPTGQRNYSECLVVSDDTDVFIILLCNPVIYGKGVMHVLNDSVHFVDTAVDCLRRIGTCGAALSALYCIAGCDFTPSIYGLTHDVFWKPFIMFITKYNGNLSPNSSSMSEENLHFVDTLFCMVYLARRGKTLLCNESDRKSFINEQLRREDSSEREVNAMRKATFVSEQLVGSVEWRNDVRNYIADNVSSSNELIPDLLHIHLHWKRAMFITTQYWGRASLDDLSGGVIGGCSNDNGYDEEGGDLLDRNEDVQQVLTRIRAVIMNCSCKGDCSSRRCSCFRNSQTCVGCGCNDDVCQNRFKEGDQDAVRNEINSGEGVSILNEASAAPQVELESAWQITQYDSSGESDSDSKSLLSAGSTIAGDADMEEVPLL